MSQSSPHHYTQDDKYEQGVLPRLREVLGDMLECPAPKPKRSHNRYNGPSFASSSSSYASTSQDARGPHGLAASRAQLPPIQRAVSPREAEKQHSYPSSSHSLPTQGNNFKERHASERVSSPFGDFPTRREERSPPHNTSRSAAATHSYDVFLLTSEQELSHKRSSMQDDHYEVAKELAISTSSGKYSCTECGRRFQKNSTLKNHLTTHSGERPYECPDCRRSFSVSSNMRRHLERVHRSSGGVAPGN